ncbi:hypothetical protein BDV06DRAFT_229590, partial [Aspergillus oleicola]
EGENPPSPEATPEKPAKKERTRAERSAGVTSWGLFSATPTKKSHTREARLSKKEPSPAIAKSKPTKHRPRESENEVERSSASEKDRRREARASRGMGFSNFILGTPPQPTRTKSVRRSAPDPKRSSRHQSVDIDDSGMPTPPPDDAPMPDKAARMMGTRESSRRERHRELRKSRAPDPYALDDDDLVVVDRADAEQPSKEGSRHSGSRHSGQGSARRSRSNPEEPQEGERDPEVFSGPDDMAFVEAPPSRERERRVKRSNTTHKKQESGGLMGLFGSLRKSTKTEATPERRKSRSRRDDDARYTTELERDEARRRREDRRKRSSRPDTDGEGVAPEPPVVGAFPDDEVEDPDARRAARRAKRMSRQAPDAAADELRETELREAEERRARRREEKARQREERA